MKKLFSIIMVAALTAGSANAAAAKAGTVTLTKGGVDVVKANAVMGKMVRQGTDLMMDDILRTKRASYAEVNVTDGTKIKVFEKSRLIFNGVARTKDGYNAEVQSGKVLFKVEKMYNVAGDFRIKTSNAVIGVKGTLVGVYAASGGTVVELYSGSVLFERASQSDLHSGMKGVAPQPVVVLAPGQGVMITPAGTVTTYRFGAPGAPSALFPGATATQGGGQSGGAGSEGQIFGPLGSDEAAQAGVTVADSPSPSPISAVGNGDSLGQVSAASNTFSNALNGTTGPANGIYNSANRPSTSAQVIKSMGTVNVHIEFH